MEKLKRAFILKRQSDKKVRAPGEKTVLSTWSETPLIGCISVAESLAEVRQVYVRGSSRVHYTYSKVPGLQKLAADITQQRTSNLNLYLSRAPSKYDSLDNLTHILYMLDYLKQVN